MDYKGLFYVSSRPEHLENITNPTYYYIIGEGDNNQQTGFVILRGLSSPNRSVELARIIVSTPGQGSGQGLLQAAAEVVFDEYGANRLWLNVFADNTRARKAYSAAGYRAEGILRQAVIMDGVYKDLVMMAILAEEYLELRNKLSGPGGPQLDHNPGN